MNTLKTNDKLFVPLIGALSIVVPAVVAILLFADLGGSALVGDVSFLPALNAGINSTVSLLLIIGLILIRQKKMQAHKRVMMSALFLSVFFLVSYILYHYAHGDVKYGGQGAIRYVYFVILITHIVLSVAVVPLALFSVYRGLAGSYERHRKIAKWTWPIWLYVSVTGVVVYLMAHPFNPGLA